MRVIKTIIIVLVLSIVLAACTTAKNPETLLMSEIDRVFSDQRQEHKFAINSNLIINNQASVDNELMKAWLPLFPDSSFKIDAGLTLQIAPNEFRIFGAIAGLDGYGDNLKEYNNGNVDFGIDLYVHKDQGVFFNDPQFYQISEALGYEFSEEHNPEEYIKIGDSELATELVSMVNNYSNINQYDGFWDIIVSITESSTEGNTTEIFADLNATEAFSYLQNSIFNWTNTINDFINATNWSLRYVLNNERLYISNIIIRHSENVDPSNKASNLIPQAEIIFTRFISPLSEDVILDPR